LKTTNVINLQKGSLAIGDKVKTSTTRFGKEYALGKPKYTYGIVKKIKGKLASILWEGEKRGMNSKVSHLTRIPGASFMMIAEDGEHFAVPTYEVAETEQWAELEQDEEDKILFDQLEKDMTKEDVKDKKERDLKRVLLPLER
jgi:hypothetical protein